MVRFVMRRIAMNVGDTHSRGSYTCVRVERKLLFSGLTRLDYIDCAFFVKTFDGAFVRAFVYCPRCFVRPVGTAFHGSSGQGCFG